MFALLTELELTSEQLLKSTRMMLGIAHVDGEKTAEEVALIREFYEGCLDGLQGPTFDSLLKDSSPSTLTGADFEDSAQKDMLMAFGVMVAFADGRLSPEESKALHECATRLEIAPDRFDEIMAMVKDHMLSQFSHLPDAESVAKVAKELEA